MKLSDYVAESLSRRGIRQVFFVSGGAAVHLVDSCVAQAGMSYVCPAHEQQGGAMADGYARVSGGVGLMITTSGPGATNLLTSISNCYFDSVPCLFLTGQVATFRLRPKQSLRQKGFQETDVVAMTQSVTKYAVQIRDPADIRYELEKALYLAREGRPGPVVVDIPDDLQRAEVNPEQLRPFVPPKTPHHDATEAVKTLLSCISHAKRPVFIVGAGIRLAGVAPEIITFIHHLHVPAVLTWGGADLLPADDPLNMGGVGVCGPRGGNFAVQTADLVIAMGTRLSQMITGGKAQLFAPRAKKVMLDIDPAELEKYRSDEFQLDVALPVGLRDFCDALPSLSPRPIPDRFVLWRNMIRGWREAYPVPSPEQVAAPGTIHPGVFIRELSSQIPKKRVIVGDTGANLAWMMQHWQVKQGQRIFSAWNHTPMGYALPAAIGAAKATSTDVYCLTGDGGLMMCLAELVTVVKYKLPIKIFLFNNHGHGIQRQTVDTWLHSRYIGVDADTGLGFPDFIAVAAACGLPTITINSQRGVKQKIARILKKKGPVFCNVEIDPGMRIVPMLKFGAGLEDLDPKLPAETIQQILSVVSS